MFGTLTIEGAAGQRLLAEGSAPVWFAGQLLLFGDWGTFARGDFYQVSTLGVNRDSSLSVQYQPLEVSRALAPGNNTIALPPCAATCLVHSEITAPYYVMMRLHLLESDGYGGSYIKELSAARSFDQHGTIGVTSYTAGAGGAPALVVSNPRFPANQTSIALTATQLSGVSQWHT